MKGKCDFCERKKNVTILIDLTRKGGFKDFCLECAVGYMIQNKFIFKKEIFDYAKFIGANQWILEA